MAKKDNTRTQKAEKNRKQALGPQEAAERQDNGTRADTDNDRKTVKKSSAEGKRRGKCGKQKNNARGSKEMQRKRHNATAVHLDTASVVVLGDLADANRPLPLTTAVDAPQVEAQGDLDVALSCADDGPVAHPVTGIIETGKVAADAATKAARKAAAKAAKRERKAARKQDRKASRTQMDAPVNVSLSSGEAANDAAELAAALAQEVAEQPAAHVSADGAIEVLIEAIVGSDSAAVIAVQVLHEVDVTGDPEAADGVSGADMNTNTNTDTNTDADVMMHVADEDANDADAETVRVGADLTAEVVSDVLAAEVAPVTADDAATDVASDAVAVSPAADVAGRDIATATTDDAADVAADVTAAEDASTLSGAAPDVLSDDDLYLFNEGRHLQLYQRLGAHREARDGVDGWRFAVWAPNAEQVAVTGDFNAWDAGAHALTPQGNSGIWSGFVAGARAGQVYKFHITSRTGEILQKADPFATHAEVPPLTGSVLWEMDYAWSDGDWMAQRAAHNAADAAISIYELHPGSWRHRVGEGDRWLTYRELAEPLAEHLTAMGFTHVEFLPLMEHPFYGSWGYQSTGYFAPTSRYGSPQDLMYLIDVLHQRGIGVILDWVPSHFPDDPHGLARFDGTHLFEHADPRQGFHPDWGSMIFNYGRNEVRSFLLSSAMYWFDLFHIDGIRVDAVASMLYLDYSRQPGEWIPNQFGGRENLEAVEFLRQLNTDVYGRFPDVQIIAEESTAWPGVSRPVYDGGLGFGMKWDMGWMHDTLQYFSHDPIHRRFHHDQLTFRMVYAFNEAFVLPFSHDEVVHGKGSMLSKQAGDTWQQFANLRLLYTYMYAQPGKKLLFMGSEFGTRVEWNHEASLNWDESRADPHRGIAHLVGDLNRLQRAEPALHTLDFAPSGFVWLEATDADNSVLAFMRTGGTPGDELLCIFNLTPVPRYGYRIGAPQDGFWGEVFNSDAGTYWGSGVGNLGGVHAEPTPWHGQPFSLPLTLPPLAGVILRRTGASAT